MFRFIALAWDSSQTAASSAAAHLGQAWQERADWTPALVRPGLQVFTFGEKSGVNQASPLQGDQGIVLGKMFHRRDRDSVPERNVTITCKEAAGILSSCGRDLVNNFWGRYVAFLPTLSGTTCVLRDPSGTLPCYLIRHEGVSIVFSWLEDVLQMLGQHAPRQVNWDALTAQLLRGALIGHETGLQGVIQVLPGELFDLHSETKALLWNATDFARSTARHDANEAAQLLRQSVQACTEAWASCYDTLLLRLSGGVDSSILLSCLAPGRTKADVISVNYHSEGSDSDERHYARLAAARVGRDLLERERDVGFRIDRILQIARMPDPVPYVGWMNAGTDARLAAAHGAPAMFTGAGGDSLFFEFPRWWPAADYLCKEGLNAGFAAAAMDAARLGKLSIWRTIALALKQRTGPSLQERNLMGHDALLALDISVGNDETNRFVHPAARDAGDLPIGKYMQTMALIYPLGYYDPFERASAPELVNPLLSQPLVELCLQLPTYLLTQGGMEEHVKAVLLSNIDFAREVLLDGQLAARGLLDRKRLAELLSGRPTALAGPISQIHSLVAVEAWLSRWGR